MTNSIEKHGGELTTAIIDQALKTVYVVVDCVSTSNKSIDEKQKEIWLSSLKFKEKELNILLEEYKNRELTKEESDLFHKKVETIVNSILEINKEYDAKLEKRRDENIEILQLCLKGLFTLGLTGIIGLSSTKISSNFKKLNSSVHVRDNLRFVDCLA